MDRTYMKLCENRILQVQSSLWSNENSISLRGSIEIEIFVYLYKITKIMNIFVIALAYVFKSLKMIFKTE